MWRGRREERARDSVPKTRSTPTLSDEIEPSQDRSETVTLEQSLKRRWSVDYQKTVIGSRGGGRKTPCRYSINSPLLAQWITFQVEDLIGQGAALLPARSFGPDKEDVAAPTHYNARVLAAFPFAGRRNRLNCAAA